MLTVRKVLWAKREIKFWIFLKPSLITLKKKKLFFILNMLKFMIF